MIYIVVLNFAIQQHGRQILNQWNTSKVLFLFVFFSESHLKARDVSFFHYYVLNIDLLVNVASAKFLLNYPFSFCNKFLL